MYYACIHAFLNRLSKKKEHLMTCTNLDTLTINDKYKMKYVKLYTSDLSNV